MIDGIFYLLACPLLKPVPSLPAFPHDPSLFSSFLLLLCLSLFSKKIDEAVQSLTFLSRPRKT